MLIFRRTDCIITASGIDCSPLSTGILYGRLQTVTIPDAVVIQSVLLKMSIVLLETCRGFFFLGVLFYSPLAGFSLLAYEVS